MAVVAPSAEQQQAYGGLPGSTHPRISARLVRTSQKNNRAKPFDSARFKENAFKTGVSAWRTACLSIQGNGLRYLTLS